MIILGLSFVIFTFVFESLHGLMLIMEFLSTGIISLLEAIGSRDAADNAIAMRSAGTTYRMTLAVISEKSDSEYKRQFARAVLIRTADHLRERMNRIAAQAIASTAMAAIATYIRMLMPLLSESPPVAGMSCMSLVSE